MRGFRNIKIARGDTKRIVFKLDDINGINRDDTDITSWTNFELIIDSLESPPDNTTHIATLNDVEIEPLAGRIGFLPDDTIAVGDYFYNARATDNNLERNTFAIGKYDVYQDIS